MVNSDELISTTENVTLQARCRTNRCRCNRISLYIYYLHYVKLSCFVALFDVEKNPVTTSVYTTPCLQSQIVCVTN
jgi:hypothetical protein